MLKVSVIIPNYNHAPYLQQRIDSILNQTCQNFELIILDDCSTDNSKDVIEPYRNHPKVSQIVYNEKNSGSTFKQWRKGIGLTKGEYIWIAESDDYCDACFLERTLDVMGKNSNTGLVYCRSVIVNESNEIKRNWEYSSNEPDKYLWENSFQYNGNEFVKKYMFYENRIPNASAVLFRKKILESFIKSVNGFKLNGDWFLYMKILSVADVAFLSEPLNYFREHDHKGSRKNIRNFNNIKEYYKLFGKTMKLFHLDTVEKQSILNHIFKLWKQQLKRYKFYRIAPQLWNVLPTAFKVDPLVINRFLRRY
jgi:glycosyltransferase involved in cell wall biosynthesis